MELDLVIASVELDLFVAGWCVVVGLLCLGGAFARKPQRVGGPLYLGRFAAGW